MPTAVIYTRVSTDEQASNYSPATQLSACREYAASHGFSIIGEFFDDYTGAVPIEARPEGSKAFSALQSSADALIAFRMDRIVRPPEEGDEWDIPILIRGLAKLGKEIHTVNRGKLGTSFSDLLIAMLDARTAGEERRSIAERARRGIRAKAGSGKVVGNGRSLYGYSYRDGQYVVNESESVVVQEIFDLYTKKRLGGSLIAHILTDRREPSPGDARGYGRSAYPPGTWDCEMVMKRLRHAAYCGDWKLKSSDGKVYVVSVPSIISREQWNEAQMLRKLNNTYATRNNADRFRYLLRGMVVCGDCGRHFVGNTAKRRGGYTVPYYLPSGRYRTLSDLGNKCQEFRIRAEPLHAEAWEYAVKVINASEDDLALALLDSAGRRHSERDELESKLAEIDGKIAACEAEAEKLSAQIQVGGIVGAKLKTRIESINTRHAGLVARRAEIEASIPAILSSEKITDLIELRRDLQGKLDDATSDQKRQVFELMLLRVTVSGGKAVISSIFPWKSKPIDLTSFAHKRRTAG